MHDFLTTAGTKRTVRFTLGVLACATVFLVLWGIGPAHALETGIEFAEGTGLASEDIRVIVARVIRALFGLVGIVFVSLLLYGGWMYMTAAGEAEKVNKAKAVMRNAAIGVAIMLSAYSIASFIIRTLIGATTGVGVVGRPAAYGSGGGALGGGIIESHYPPRNAIGIARNTSIVVTFKESMLRSTLISDTNNSGVLGDCIDSNNNGRFDFTDANSNGIFDANDSSECDLVATEFVRIRKSSEMLPAGFVRASVTPDGKTFVLRPLNLLGSPSENTPYTVDLTNAIKKENGDSAFGSLGSYSWNFEVSTVVDLTPPTVTSVVPVPARSVGDTNPRNSVVQINFSEAINPMTIRGVARIVNDAIVGALAQNSFDIIGAQLANNQFIGGEFFYSNQYRTVEFVTNDPCGINACGEVVYCLPGNEQITVTIRSAVLDVLDQPTASFPYTGIVDMADNSLDGNGDGVAQGPQSQSGRAPYNRNAPNVATQGDDHRWTFNTNDRIDLVPPEIISMYPAPGAFNASPTQPYEVQFSKLMMASTLKPDSGYGDGYCGCATSADCNTGQTCSPAGRCVDASGVRVVCTNVHPCKNSPDQCIQKEHVTLVMPPADVLESRLFPADGWAYWIQSSVNFETGQTTALIQHERLGSRLEFVGRVGSSVRDLYQNCFQPCAGPGCQKLATPIPGQYVVRPGAWIPSDVFYPTCDLSQAGTIPAGRFSITYADVNTGQQRSQNIAAFGMELDAGGFYGYTSNADTRIDRFGAPFSGMFAAGRVVSFLYKDTVQNTYYLTTIGGAHDGANGAFTVTFSGAGGLDRSVSSPHEIFVVRDDASDTYTNDGTTARAEFTFGSHTDGTMMSLGGGSVNYSFSTTLSQIQNVTEWIWFYPGGSIRVPLDRAVMISFTAD